VRGLTAVALSEIAGVSPQAISQYESGRSSPSPEVLQAITAAVNLPEHFFIRPRREPGAGVIFFRSMSAATKSARARAERRFEWLRDIVQYLSEFVEFPPSNIPELGLPEDPLLLSDDEIEDAAARLRRYWRMGDGPIGNVTLLLENHGAILARDKLGAETLDGLSQFVIEESRPFIIIGTDKGTSVRWRFDAAHELGHVVLHAAVDQRVLSRPELFKRVEEQAHRFAAAFLLPVTTFGDDLFAVNLDTLLSIKRKWGVSIAMMIMRARHAGLISEEAERRLWINLSRRGWRKSEPYDDSMEPEEPRLLRRALEMILAEAAQTPADIVANLALAPFDIESLTGLPRGYLEQDFPRVKLIRSLASEAEVDDVATPADVIQLPLRRRGA
jgi:Zn-dependent peptidase ImmA (M78 family)